MIDLLIAQLPTIDAPKSLESWNSKITDNFAFIKQ